MLVVVYSLFGKFERFSEILFVRMSKADEKDVTPANEFLGVYIDSVLGQYGADLFLEEFLARTRSNENCVLDRGGIDLHQKFDEFRVAPPTIDAPNNN